MEKDNKKLIIGAAAGLLAGAIAGVLFAPKSGKETRAEIGNYLHEMKDKIAEELEKAGKVSKEKYQELVKKIVETYEKEKKITTEEAVEIKDKLSRSYEAVVDIIKEDKDK